MEQALTCRQVCRRLGIDRLTLGRMLKRGAFRGVAFKPSGVDEWRFDCAALEKRIDQWKMEAH